MRLRLTPILLAALSQIRNASSSPNSLYPGLDGTSPDQDLPGYDELATEVGPVNDLEHLGISKFLPSYKQTQLNAILSDNEPVIPKIRNSQNYMITPKADYEITPEVVVYRRDHDKLNTFNR